MPIHRPLWYRLTPKKNLPGLPCPRCNNGKLKLGSDGLKIQEPNYSSDFRENDWENWEPYDLVERWSAELKCDETACGEVVHLIGDVELVQTEVRTPDGDVTWGYEDVLRIQAAFPAPPLFRLSNNVPRSVRNELLVAFRMYWTDRSACVSRLRTAVERLLDDQKIPREKTSQSGKVSRMDLKQRIDAFTSGVAHAEQLQGLRNIGNLGTHGGSDDVTDEDLFDAVDVLEFVLTGIYDTQAINAKATKLKGKKPDK